MMRTLPPTFLSLTALGAALALAACSKEPEAPPTQPTETEEVFQEEPAPAAEATELSEEPAAEGEVSQVEIPEAVQGRWGMVAADCTSKRGDAKGLLEVSADQLKFYESVAKLGEIKEAGETRIRATFAYTGEGQSWSQDVVLDAQDDGKTLIRREYGKDAMPGPQKYTRCT